MSDFEDFEELFDKEADTNAKQNIKASANEDLDVADEDNRLESEDEQEDYEDAKNSKITSIDTVELDEYLKRKIHHLCISSSSYINNKFDITSTTLSNLKQLKQGLQFDSKKLESHSVFIQLYNNNILIHDLIPILALYSNTSEPSDYLNKCVIRTLEIVYKLTQRIELNDLSSIREAEEYNEVKKIQIIYKKQLLNSKALSSFVKLLVTGCLKEDLQNKENCSKVTILVINIIKNMLEIEPFEMIMSGEKWKKLKYKQLKSGLCVPASVSMDDINITQIVKKFDESGLFPVLIKLTQQLGQNKLLLTNLNDEERIYVPLMDIWYNIIKDVSPKTELESDNHFKKLTSKSNLSSGSKLSDLLAKDRELKKTIIKNTSSRHSKFGSLITVETGDNTRTQLTNINNTTLADKGMDFLDLNKQNLPGIRANNADDAEGWVQSKYLMSLFESDSLLSLNLLNQWIDKLIFSKAFNNLIGLLTEKLKDESMEEIPQVCCKYLILATWFIEYHNLRINNQIKFEKLLNKLLNLDNNSVIKLIFEVFNHFSSEKSVDHCIIHAFNKFYTALLSILTSSNRNIITYYWIVIFILKHSDSHNAMYSYTRKLHNSKNISLQESSIILTSYLIKFNHQIEFFAIEEIGGQLDSLMKHNLFKLAKALDFDNLSSTIDYISTSFLGSNKSLNHNLIFHHDTISTIILLLDTHLLLSYSSQKTILKLLNLCHKHLPTALQRIDLLIQFRQLLKNTSPRARFYPHISSFSTVYLSSLTDRLIKNPKSAPIELLFVKKNHSINELYGDKEFLRSGELSKEFLEGFMCVKCSEFKQDALNLLMALTPVEALKNKFGMIIGALLEKEMLDLVDCVLTHLKSVKTKIENKNIEAEDFSLIDKTKETFVAIDKGAKKNSDFRLFLKMLGYDIPKTVDQECKLSRDTDIPKLNFNITIITTFIETPLELDAESDISMHSLFIRFDEKKIKTKRQAKANDTNSSDNETFRAEEYEGSDGFVVSDADENQDEYFKQLIYKNVKKPNLKTKKQTSKRQSNKNTSEKSSKQKKKKSTIVSKAILSSSSDDDDDLETESDVIFFENELYSKLVTLLHNGQVSGELQNQINEFRDLRAKKEIIDDEKFKDLFKGSVPQVKDLNSLIAEFKVSTGHNENEQKEDEVLYETVEVNENRAPLKLTQTQTSEQDKVRISRINKLREVMGHFSGPKTQSKGLLNEDEDNTDDSFSEDDGSSDDNFNENIKQDKSKSATIFYGFDENNLENKNDDFDDNDEDFFQPLQKKRKITIEDDNE